MLNHISVTPCEMQSGVTCAVVATDDNNEVLLVDPDNAGPSIPSVFVLPSVAKSNGPVLT